MHWSRRTAHAVRMILIGNSGTPERCRCRRRFYLLTVSGRRIALMAGMVAEFADALSDHGPPEVFGGVAEYYSIGHAFTGDVIGLIAMPFHQLDCVPLNALAFNVPTSPPSKHGVFSLFVFLLSIDQSKARVKQITHRVAAPQLRLGPKVGGVTPRPNPHLRSPRPVALRPMPGSLQ